MAVPSDAHLLAFGRVVHNFASVESGIKIALSGILDAHIDACFIAFEPYSATQLRNVAKSMGKERLKPKVAEQFCSIVGDWFAFAHLRNVIAHSRWTNGSRPNAIKPRRLSIREGRADWIGESDEEKDYTAAELEADALKLNAVNERMKKFLQTSGLAAVIERNIAAANAEMSAASGKPTNSPSK